MKNTLITVAVLSVLAQSSAYAFELNLPSFLGGKSEAMPVIAVGAASSSTAEPALSASKPISQSAKVANAVVNTAEVNPYTGVRADVENTRIRIEAAMAEADLYEKEYEAGKKKYLLDNKDKLYKKELSEKLSVGSSGSGNNNVINVPDLTGLDAPVIKPTSKKNKKVISPVADIANMPVVPPAPPAPQLVGILSNGNTKSAILSMGSETSTVSEGGSFAGRKVSEITDTSVTLGDKKLKLVTTANTFINPDKQDIGGGGKGTQSNANPMQSIQPATVATDSFPMPSM